MTEPGRVSSCRHCGEAVEFAPYFLDGKLPNPPVWKHVAYPGGRTCRTAPEGWPGDDWPTAEPSDG